MGTSTKEHMEGKQPLIDYLGGKNPELFTKNLKGGSNSQSKNEDWSSPSFICKWKEFRFKTLESMYDGALLQVLQEVFPCKDYPDIAQKPYRELVDEDSVEGVLTLWTQSVVNEALQMAQSCLYKSEPQNVICMAKGGQAYCRGFAPEKGTSKRVGPDWAGIQPDSVAQTKPSVPNNILPGDTKVSRKWNSNNIVQGSIQTKYLSGDWILPINQISTYCIRCDARYGYLITDKELVVVRISKMTNGELTAFILDRWESEDVAPLQGDSQATDASYNGVGDQDTKYVLEYKAIRWTDTKRVGDPRNADLTVNLALWWLHILASVENGISNKYPPLRKITKPTCFTNQPLSEKPHSNLPINSRKRSTTARSDDSFKSDLPRGPSTRSTKRARTDVKDN